MITAQADVETIAAPLLSKDKGRTPVVAFAGEHCHPSFYSTGHGAYLTGRTAAQLVIRTVKDASGLGGETTYNLQDASVSDLSTWLQEVNPGPTGSLFYSVVAVIPLLNFNFVS